MSTKVAGTTTSADNPPGTQNTSANPPRPLSSGIHQRRSRNKPDPPMRALAPLWGVGRTVFHSECKRWDCENNWKMPHRKKGDWGRGDTQGGIIQLQANSTSWHSIPLVPSCGQWQFLGVRLFVLIFVFYWRWAVVWDGLWSYCSYNSKYWFF